jgi:imidazolonepropionase-like amidohydrolase
MNMKSLDFVFTLLAVVLYIDSVAIGQPKVDVHVKDISIFDPRTGSMIPHRDIVVSDTRIADILPAGKYTGSANTVINGLGKFAIPGLFDNHVHLARMTEETAGLFLVHGITSVRDMGTEPARITDWRKRISYGRFYGPRIVQACGPMLESKGEERKDHWVVKSPEDARAVVARIAAAGMDCVKLRTFADEKTYLAIAAAAIEHKLMLTGHAPEQLDPELALKAGQRTFEHAFYPYPLSKLTAEKKQSLFSAFKASRAAAVPTLIAWKPFTLQTSELERMLSNYREGKDFDLSQELLDHWERTIGVHRSQKRGSKGWQEAVATASSDIGQMHAAGVTVLPGSDTGAPFVVPGLSLHEELYLLVHAVGMTPAEVLSAATLGSAAFYGLEKELGSIAPGKIADFVILNKDPLQDIKHIREVDAVVFRGEVLTHAHLNIFLGNTKQNRKNN